MKSAFVSIIGRPSAGKSTLLNVFCGHKVSIVSKVPQTTRNKIRGIVTKEKGQLIFIDTPGYHNSDRKFNIYMKNAAESSLEEVDLVLYVIDSTRPVGDEEKEIISIVSKFKDKMIIALNKTDVTSKHYDAIREHMEEAFDKTQIMDISAQDEKGIDELLNSLYEMAPEGEMMYPEDFYTDQEPEFRISEIIREKAILLSKEEVPHSLYVEIADMERSEEDGKLWIRAFLTVEKESQKGILVGKAGNVIKQIRQGAQKDLHKLFPYKIHLDLRVKVNKKWRRKDNLLRDLIR